VIFASGPTNYRGDSDQSLKLFIVDVDTGKLVRTVDTGIKNAFGGRLFTEGLDFDEDGQTDYVALGFSYREKKNWRGGILFLNTSEGKVDNWEYDVYFRGIEPITAKVAFMKCFNNWYMYFGTGKWFFKIDESKIDQPNMLYGIRINCNAGIKTCQPNENFSTSPSDACGFKPPISWKVPLNTSDKAYFPERMITDPTVSNQNIIIFTTTEPTEDVCGFGGRTRLWALNCATGGSIEDECSSYPIRNVEGKLLLQLSGGDIKEVGLKSFKGGKLYKKVRKTSSWMTGTPPETPTPLITSGKIKGRRGEIILWLEK